MNEETPSGSGTTHGIAHGIAIQQVQNGAEVTDPDLQNVSELHERNAHLIINELEPCFAKAKAEPNFNVRKVTPENCDFDDAKLSDFFVDLGQKTVATSKSKYSILGWMAFCNFRQTGAFR